MALDKFKEECGVFAVYGHKEAANLTYLGLYALQHRGQESAGIVSSDGIRHHAEIGMGLVSEIFNEDKIAGLKGTMSIGHNRYSTQGETQLRNAQPMAIEYFHGPLALAHNGNLVNAPVIRRELEEEGSIFRSTMDSEVIIHLIAKSKEKRLQDRVIEALERVEGAFSLAIMSPNELIVACDPHGFRPLAMARLGSSYIFASETCAFDLIDATFVREVEPGEVIIINNEGHTSLFPFKKEPKKHCIFEFIYFARPDSRIFGANVQHVRQKLGQALAKEQPVAADCVVPVPDSGVVAALGYAKESGIPYEKGIIRNHYVGRTFIEPLQAIRHFGVKIKLNPVRQIMKDKSVVLVDDSIVRGTTSRKLVKMARDAGAREVHMRISSPPATHPCFYGIDTPARTDLIASTYSVEEVREFIGADSLAYLSIEGLTQAVEGKKNDFCIACFNGEYPVATPPLESQLALLEGHSVSDKKETTVISAENPAPILK
ncbi:Amidophosphoribosyltransferase [hydrothermal vent metagenome]|uniref:amidophosphoribosyltransferase n=1 Tax=hydrothermal vent metagenome TaxID=652676 RepID=A0A3B1BSX1_9ZZZZ